LSLSLDFDFAFVIGLCLCPLSLDFAFVIGLCLCHWTLPLSLDFSFVIVIGLCLCPLSLDFAFVIRLFLCPLSLDFAFVIGLFLWPLSLDFAFSCVICRSILEMTRLRINRFPRNSLKYLVLSQRLKQKKLARKEMIQKQKNFVFNLINKIKSGCKLSWQQRYKPYSLKYAVLSTKYCRVR
jgi:hypothetical protein